MTSLFDPPAKIDAWTEVGACYRFASADDDLTFRVTVFDNFSAEVDVFKSGKWIRHDRYLQRYLLEKKYERLPQGGLGL